MADPRFDFVRKMAAEGMDEDTMRRALAVYDQQHNAKPIDPNEPDTYLGGAVKGLKEGALGGLKGFGEGLLESPISAAKGLATVLTQSPEASALQTIQGIQRIPAAVAGAGRDPEGFGRDVGNLTGQTELGIAGSAGLPAGAEAAANFANRAGLTASDIVPPSIRGMIPPAIPKILRAVVADRPNPLIDRYAPNVSGYQAASPVASLEEAAPSPAPVKISTARPLGQATPDPYVAVKAMNPADMPRDWHAFLGPEAREAADPASLSQAAALHRELANADQSYRAITGPTAAALRSTPPSVWESLLADLARKSGS